MSKKPLLHVVRYTIGFAILPSALMWLYGLLTAPSTNHEGGRGLHILGVAFVAAVLFIAGGLIGLVVGLWSQPRD